MSLYTIPWYHIFVIIILAKYRNILPHVYTRLKNIIETNERSYINRRKQLSM